MHDSLSMSCITCAVIHSTLKTTVEECVSYMRRPDFPSAPTAEACAKAQGRQRISDQRPGNKAYSMHTLATPIRLRQLAAGLDGAPSTRAALSQP